jgi:protein tyrosine phosphatase (PTP) superfamily phosphohydrolase (DUF442 family)
VKFHLLAAFLICPTVVGCGQREAARISDEASPSYEPAADLAADEQRESDPDGLQNFIKSTDRIYSGSEPHGEQGFESLEHLGVKTVISVDGAKPNVELANKHGIRYVHIPIGYDGVPNEAGDMLARSVKEVEGPLYIHCHHGKHRGPAAAAIASIASGAANAKDALQFLQRAGTSKGYAGLWRDVGNYTPPPDNARLPELVEVAEVGSFVAAMAQIDRSFDNLKLCRDANWRTPSDHPDLVQEQEALLLQEGLHEASRNLDDDFDDRFKSWLSEAEVGALVLLTILKDKGAEGADGQFESLEQSCKQCHVEYRDQ